MGLDTELHRARRGVEPRALAGGAGILRQIVNLHLGKGLLAAAVVVVPHGVVERLALFLGEPHAGADTLGAPAMLAVVREQARIELGITGAAHRAGPLGRERLQRADAGGGDAVAQGLAQTGQAAQHMHHALAMLQRARQRLAQGAFVLW